MDGIGAPISTSRAYQEVKLFYLRAGEQAPKAGSPWQEEDNPYPDVASRLQEIRDEAMEHDDYALVLATYELSDDPIPFDRLLKTGMSGKTWTLLCLDTLASSRAPDCSSQFHRGDVSSFESCLSVGYFPEIPQLTAASQSHDVS